MYLRKWSRLSEDQGSTQNKKKLIYYLQWKIVKVTFLFVIKLSISNASCDRRRISYVLLYKHLMGDMFGLLLVRIKALK